jgi:tetratricopeptide (TPR) repeat protein
MIRPPPNWPACAFLAPEPIPEEMFTSGAAELPAALATQVADPLAWPQILAHLTRQALARVDQRGLVMHRLTQAILRDRLSAEEAIRARERTEAILAASDPGPLQDPATWPEWARLMPHLLATDLIATGNPRLRRLVCTASEYLVARGDARASQDLTSRLYPHWRQRLSADDPGTLRIAVCLAWALHNLGDYTAARNLAQETLARCRRVLGDDHPDTLTSANILAIVLRRLGEVQAARDLDQDTLDRRRRVLGDDHPDTLFSADNLANDLRQLGEVQAARSLDQDILDRRRRLLGDDHPDTLTSAGHLAEDLRLLGEVVDDI